MGVTWVRTRLDRFAGRQELSSGRIPRVTKTDYLVEGAKVILMSGLGLLAILHHRGGAGGSLLYSLPLMGGAFLPLIWRTRYPFPVLWITGVSALIEMLAKGTPGFLALGPLIALFTVVTRSERRISMVAGVVTFIGVSIGVYFGRPQRHSWGSVLFPIVVIAAMWLVGDNIRVRREYVGQLEDRARRLEGENEANAARAASEERTRIARELHDAVAHHVSVIAVQAGAARMLSSSHARGDDGTEIGDYERHGMEDSAVSNEISSELMVLASIESTARQALGELRTLLGVLRHDSTENPTRSPTPEVSDLHDLVTEVSKAGLPVTLNIDSVLETGGVLSPLMGLSIYRIVQEALTNVLKHSGKVLTSVDLGLADGNVELRVASGCSDDNVSAARNPANSEGKSVENVPGGHGIIGMRERVALFGGEFEALHTDEGGFLVSAMIPLGG